MSAAYDAVIVGGGHNGLVCGAYLAKAGVKVLVLERREMTGGAAVTEELWPGYKVSTASYYMGLLQPKVILDLELQKYGFEVCTADPIVYTLDGGRYFTAWGDPDKFQAEIARLSNRDAEAWPAFNAHMQKVGAFMKQLVFEIPVDPGSGKMEDLKRLAGFVWRFRKVGPQFYDIYNLLTLSAYDYLSRWFENDDVKLVLGFYSGGGGANASLKSPGSAYMLARSIVREQTTAAGPSGFMKGGMGAISDAIRASGEAHGMQVRENAPVAQIVNDFGRVTGVRLESGEVINAKIVIANANAKTTFLRLLDPDTLPESFVRDIRSMRTLSTVFRVNLALDALPEIPDFPGRQIGFDYPTQLNLSGSLGYMEKAFRDSQLGEMSEDPFLIVKIPSRVDRTIVPEGRHLMTIFGGHAPYNLAHGHWDDRREDLWQVTLKTLQRTFPDIEKHILHRVVMTPVDLERRFDLPTGHVHHGEISADQMFFRRPAPHYAAYRGPLERLYMCGASTHPGGGVTGTPGHNAARVILADRRKWN